MVRIEKRREVEVKSSYYPLCIETERESFPAKTWNLFSIFSDFCTLRNHLFACILSDWTAFLNGTQPQKKVYRKILINDSLLEVMIFVLWFKNVKNSIHLVALLHFSYNQFLNEKSHLKLPPLSTSLWLILFFIFDTFSLSSFLLQISTFLSFSLDFRV